MKPPDPNDTSNTSQSEASEVSDHTSRSFPDDPSSRSDLTAQSDQSSHSVQSDQSSQEDHSSRQDDFSQPDTSVSSDASSQADHSSSSDQSDQSYRKERAERNVYDALIIEICQDLHDRNEKISDKDLCDRINRKLPPGKKPITIQQLRPIKMRLKKTPEWPSSSHKERSDRSSLKEPSEQSFRSDSSNQKEHSDQSQRSGRKDRQETTEQSSPSSWKDDLTSRFDSFQLLPKKEKQGRKETRDCVKFGLTLDTNLYKIIETEAERRYWPIAVTFEWALWNLLNNPPLSYSPSEPVREPMAEPEPVKVDAEKKRKTGRKPKGRKVAEEPKETKKGRRGRRKKTS